MTRELLRVEESSRAHAAVARFKLRGVIGLCLIDKRPEKQGVPAAVCVQLLVCPHPADFLDLAKSMPSCLPKRKLFLAEQSKNSCFPVFFAGGGEKKSCPNWRHLPNRRRRRRIALLALSAQRSPTAFPLSPPKNEAGVSFLF